MTRYQLQFMIIISMFVAGCAVGPNFHRPKTPVVSTYTESALPEKTVTANSKAGGTSQTFAARTDIPAEWWMLFHSQSLNDLIVRGIKNSPNLKAAKAALVQAQENYNAEFGSLLLPAFNANATAERERFSASGFGSAIGTSSLFSLYNANVNVSYLLDIFGGSRRELEAYRAQVDYQRFELEAAYLSLTGNIITIAISESALRGQIKATEELIKSLDRQLFIVKEQFKRGGASKVDVLAQETQVAQTKASLPILENRLSQARSTLYVLIGEFPDDGTVPKFDLDSIVLPTNLPTRLPSELVRQRPDIRASEALLHAASAQVGVATAQLFPQLTLSGNYGNQNNHLHNLFTGPSTVWNISGNLLQPIFHGGALLANRRAAIAAYQQAHAQYQQTVLLAFKNVGDSLASLDHDALALQAEADAERAASHALTIAEAQYKLGGISFLALLIVQRQYHQAVINRIQVQATRYADTAALFQALGGGWWHRDDQAQVSIN